MGELCDISPRKNVFLIFDYNGKLSVTPVQEETKKLVDGLREIYGGKCNISRYMEDYPPGSNVLDELIRRVKTSDMVCIIMTEESVESKMLIYVQQTSLIKVINDAKYLTIIGVGIKDGLIPEYYNSKTCKVYSDFESVQQDDFLDGIFLKASPIEVANNSVTPVSSRCRNIVPIQESSGHGTSDSQIPESSGHGTSDSQIPESSVDGTSDSLIPEAFNEGKNNSPSAEKSTWSKKIQENIRNPDIKLIGALFVFVALIKIAPHYNVGTNTIHGAAFILETFFEYPFMELADHFGIFRNVNR